VYHLLFLFIHYCACCFLLVVPIMLKFMVGDKGSPGQCLASCARCDVLDLPATAQPSATTARRLLKQREKPEQMQPDQEKADQQQSEQKQPEQEQKQPQQQHSELLHKYQQQQQH
jgi:hypothetical protein